MKSSSESIPLLVMVTGVGGAAALSMVAAEAILLFEGTSDPEWEDVVASAAFRFLVVGEMVPVYRVVDGMGDVSRQVGQTDWASKSRLGRKQAKSRYRSRRRHRPSQLFHLSHPRA